MSFFDDAGLVMLPNGVKDDKLYSIKPTDGSGDFTFSRDGSGASKATRVNSSNLIEKGRTNLIKKSNAFGSSPWTLSSGETVNQNAAGFDGTANQAWTFTKNDEFGKITASSLSHTGINTFSIYAKAGTIDELALRFTVDSSNIIVKYNLNDGSLTSANAAFISTPAGVSAGNGFFRFAVSINGSITELQIRSEPAEASGSIIIQNSQLEPGLAASAYIDNTSATANATAGLLGDMPRLDYTGGASCPSLLMEPARENKLTHSEYFGAWTAQSGITVTTNTSETLSPEGLNNAAKIVSSDSTKGFFLAGLSVTNPASRTIYLKGASGGETLDLKDASENGGSTAVTLTTDWVRYEHKTTNTGDTYTGLFVDNIASGATIYAYGAQFEQHPTSNAEEANATSYIPTQGAAVTRALDATSTLTLDDNFNSVTLFIEATMSDVVRDGSTDNVKLQRQTGSDGLLAIARNSSTDKRRAVVKARNKSASNSILSEVSADLVKIAFSFDSSDGSLKAFVNGSSIASVTDTDYDEFTKFTLSGEGGKMLLHQLVSINKVFTTAELQTLTTL